MVTERKKRQWKPRGCSSRLETQNGAVATDSPLAFLSEINRLTAWPSHSLEVKKWKCALSSERISTATLSTEPRAEITQMSIKRRMRKQDVLYTLDRKLLDHKMDEVRLSFSMDTYWRHYANWKKPGRKRLHAVWSTSIKYPEQENPQRQEQTGGCQGLRTARG